MGSMNQTRAVLGPKRSPRCAPKHRWPACRFANARSRAGRRSRNSRGSGQPADWTVEATSSPAVPRGRRVRPAAASPEKRARAPRCAPLRAGHGRVARPHSRNQAPQAALASYRHRASAWARSPRDLGKRGVEVDRAMRHRVCRQLHHLRPHPAQRRRRRSREGCPYPRNGPAG